MSDVICVTDSDSASVLEMMKEEKYERKRDIPMLGTASARSTGIAFTHSGSKSREGAGEGAVGGCEGTDRLAEHVGMYVVIWEWNRRKEGRKWEMVCDREYDEEERWLFMRSGWWWWLGES